MKTRLTPTLAVAALTLAATLMTMTSVGVHAQASAPAADASVPAAAAPAPEASAAPAPLTATTTKETTHRPDLSILSWWVTVFELPCVAIGGITAENAQPLVAAGADFLAVSSAVWTHPGGPAEGVKAFAGVLAGV